MTQGIRVTPESFWARATRVGPCLEWQGMRDKRRYGRTWFGGVMWRTHRLAWTLAHGPIPVGLYVCHTCDNPPCIEPLHLFLGTAQDNSSDYVAKARGGQGRPGSSNSRAFLNEEQVEQIRTMYATGQWSHRRLATRFRVTYQTIGKVLRRERWL